jgi:hypothetical protein
MPRKSKHSKQHKKPALMVGFFMVNPAWFLFATIVG